MAKAIDHQLEELTLSLQTTFGTLTQANQKAFCHVTQKMEVL
jgi:hypothetical protein